jgi:hypothetical protein
MMAILNYTTSITPEKTAMEIQRKLADTKAQAILTEYDDEGMLNAMSFRIMTTYGMLFFRLPVKKHGVYKCLAKDNTVPKRLKTEEQANRVAWRILKDWVEAQIAIIKVEMASLEEVFLPYAQGQDGKTFYESIKENSFKMITNKTGD